ncbi:MAG: TolC family protein [Vicinamibacteria bacterium]
MVDALVLLIAATLAAADTPPRVITLDEAITRAEVANTSVLSAIERAREVHAVADGAGRSLLPRVTASSRWSMTDAPALVFMSRLASSSVNAEDFIPSALNDPSPRAHLTTRVGIEASIDAFGQVGRLRDAANATAAGTDFDADDLRARLRYEVTVAWTAAAVAREALDVFNAAVGAAVSREGEAEARSAEGVMLRSDLLRMRARRRERDADRARGLATVAQADARLAELLGASTGERFVASGLTELLTPPGVISASSSEAADDPLVGPALARLPSVQAARRRLEAARLSEAAERRSGLPEIVAGADLSDDRSAFASGRRSWSVGALARVSLFDPTREPRRAEARARLRTAQIQLEATERGVRLAIPAARQQLLASLAAYDAARGGTEDSREALRVVQERRNAGLATLTDELETEATALRAALLELGTRADTRVAWEALSRAAGGLQ